MFYKKENTVIPDAKTIVLLHSGGMSHDEWSPQVPTLKKRFNLLIPDMPGHGKTLYEEGHKPRISYIAKKVLDMLDKEGIEKISLVGSSLGGAVSLYFTLNFPDRVDDLILYRVGYKKNEETHNQTNRMSDPSYWEQYGLQRKMQKTHMPQGGPDAWKKVIKMVSMLLDPNDSDHNHNVSDLTKIKARTLLVCGDRDPLVPIEDLLLMRNSISDCGLWIIPYASHITGSNTWRAKTFADEITRFIT